MLMTLISLSSNWLLSICWQKMKKKVPHEALLINIDFYKKTTVNRQTNEMPGKPSS